ncbi:MAG: winged helix-turn-helix transcriptional regulator [Candidatus Methanodesulfokora sp.]
MSRSASLLILLQVIPVLAGGPSVHLISSGLSDQFVQELQKRVVLSNSGLILALGNVNYTGDFLIADSVFLDMRGFKPAGWIELNSTRIIPVKTGMRDFFLKRARVAVYPAHGEELFFLEREIPAVFSTNGITVISIDIMSWQESDPVEAADFISYIVSLVAPNSIPVVVVAMASVASASYLLKEQQDKLFRFVSSVPLAVIKIKGRDVLNNKRRVEIMEVLRRSAGMSANEIARTLKISRTAVLWHLSLLERAGIVNRVKVGNLTLYYCSGNWARALLFGNRKRIVEHLMRNGPRGIREIAEELGMSTETAKRNVDLLQSLGIVESRREGRRRIISLSNRFIRDSLAL